MKIVPALAAAIALGCVVLGAVKPARACGQGSGLGVEALLALPFVYAYQEAPVIGGVGYGVAIVGFAANDLLLTNLGKTPPRGYAWAEFGVTSAGTLLLSGLLINSLSGPGALANPDARTGLAIMAACSAGLAIRAGHQLSLPPPPPPPPEPDEPDTSGYRGERAPHDPDHPGPVSARWNVAPTVFAARDNTLVPGAVFLGRF
jgi:hypothetical protein